MLYLEFARRQRRWSQADLADRVKIHAHFISMIERGVGVPVSDQLARLARALDLPVEKVLQPVELRDVGLVEVAPEAAADRG